VQRQRLLDDGDLACQRRAGDAGSRADPVAPLPPKSAAHKAAAAVVLAMPISPSASMSMPGSTAIMP